MTELLQTMIARGDGHAASGDLAAALRDYDAAVNAYPGEADAWIRHGAALAELGRTSEAMASYTRATVLAPGRSELFFVQAMALQDMGRHAEAVDAFDEALLRGLDYADVWNNRGSSLRSLERYSQALESFEHALSIDHSHPEALGNRGAVLQKLNRHAEAARAFEKFASAAPDHKYLLSGQLTAAASLCDWATIERLRPRFEVEVMSGKSIVNPFFLLGLSDDPALAHAAALHYGHDFLPWLAKVEMPKPAPGEKIRIAYLSADFRQHAVGHLMIGIFEHHDRARFELTGVSYGPEEDSPIRSRFKKTFDHFIDAHGVPDAEVAERLRAMNIDIAVDLMGFTRGARPGVMARRPAPVSVSYLGFPTSTAADFMDYIIADAIVLPEDQQAHYSEQIVRMPDCYWPATAHDLVQPIAATPTRAAAGLPNEGFVFGCFNHHGKIGRPQFEIWMRLLSAVPGSVLWLIDDSGRENLRKEAAARGMDPARLVFAPKVPQAEHLARCRLMDLVLDTLPYNAHTTATDALRLGVPVVTCMGRSFSSRVGASLLAAARFPELITDDMGDYETLALALATDPERMAAIRARLGDERFATPVFDIPRFMAHWEKGFATMAARYRSGEAPAPFFITPD
jgi:predicted O-linked N-acetylglucosamine transferase (SPINDLY family)